MAATGARNQLPLPRERWVRRRSFLRFRSRALRILVGRDAVEPNECPHKLVARQSLALPGNSPLRLPLPEGEGWGEGQERFPIYPTATAEIVHPRTAHPLPGARPRDSWMESRKAVEIGRASCRERV